MNSINDFLNFQKVNYRIKSKMKYAQILLNNISFPDEHEIYDNLIKGIANKYHIELNYFSEQSIKDVKLKIDNEIKRINNVMLEEKASLHIKLDKINKIIVRSYNAKIKYDGTKFERNKIKELKKRISKLGSFETYKEYNEFYTIKDEILKQLGFMGDVLKNTSKVVNAKLNKHTKEKNMLEKLIGSQEIDFGFYGAIVIISQHFVPFLTMLIYEGQVPKYTGSELFAMLIIPLLNWILALIKIKFSLLMTVSFTITLLIFFIPVLLLIIRIARKIKTDLAISNTKSYKDSLIELSNLKNGLSVLKNDINRIPRNI